MNAHVQTVIWGLELVGFLVAMVIAGFIWRLGKRDSENRKSRPDDS